MTKPTAITRCISQEMLNAFSGAPEAVNGHSAPDLCSVQVTLNKNGELDISVNAYTENTFGNNFEIVIGKENGAIKKGRHGMSGLPIQQYLIGREPGACGIKFLGFHVHPEYDIVSGGWEFLENKDYLIEKSKEAIQAALKKLIDNSKAKLINLLHPGATPLTHVEQENEPGI